MNAVSPVETLVTDHLDLWTAALKRKSTAGRGSSSKVELYGIKKLRELILELAVRGLLVPQDPNDEPASELLKKIAAEKAKLVKEGKIKKEKPLSPVAEEERPFRVPNTWAWERLGKVCQKLTDGSHNPPADAGTGYAMLSSQNINYNKIDFQNPSRFVSEDDFQKENQRTLIEPNDVLLNIVASIGRAAVVPAEAPKFVLQRSVAVLKSGLSPQFLAKQLVAPSCLHYYEVHAKGTAQKGIYLGQLSLMPMVVPPLAEQHRIAAKVDELMALCDQLEQETEASLGAHQTLVETLLSALTSAADHAQFASAWQRIAGHFDTLFTTEESIAQLKQTLLQLAVMGKLVPQDPNDEPASELLKKIAAEKAKLVKEGKIKKEKPLPPIAEEARPFDLPDRWVWARFPELGEFGRGKSKHRPRNDPKLFEPGIYPLVQTGEVARANSVITEYHSKYSDIGLAQSRLWPEGTLCITIAANIADSALLGFDACFPDSVVGFVPFRPLRDAKYFLLFMKTARAELLKFAPATAQKNINLEILESVLVPIPPQAEIERISSKVDELMALCDQLKSRLSAAQTTQLHLADALVERAIC